MKRMCIVCDQNMMKGTEYVGKFWVHMKCRSGIFRRMDGRIEWLCDHGVGHTIWHPRGSDLVHGCDGCCSKLSKAEYKVDKGE